MDLVCEYCKKDLSGERWCGTSVSSALVACLQLREIYVKDLRGYDIDPTGLPLKFGQYDHFNQLKKTRRNLEDKEFFTISYKGFYVLFLGIQVLLEKKTSNGVNETGLLKDIVFELSYIVLYLYKSLKSLCYSVPKLNGTDVKKKLRTEMESLVKTFTNDKQIRKMVLPFKDEETLFLKWGFINNHINCLRMFLAKFGKPKNEEM